ncbi:NXPE family member 3-like [Thunnus albacares]|uniref:NXPE family member 3-like n=1 Tax=Thunnus albacares TaxID=8236 RepID=UPI001CF66428|nr:NXPE family member 3-like [Thunnus albacares]XP_044198792.1 NXPE family member 3-like [Thunnus albacares]XP_044198793.1 NXPE family member 3-like [Thunnus albacares]XP_044198794.1 NXPE family member 3-like [Thunnus albacares]XP_044198795.1 NXPE family member 3-like [Thunnus albacares]XP_044198796.1 NXPE family member 3-like [Thunnus albacares]
MKARACRETVVSFCRPKFAAIFLFLALFIFIFVYFNMDILELPHEVISTFPAPRPHLQHHFCSFQPRSPEDALEERLLLDSIAWPETPSLPDPLSLEQTTDPAHSTFTILPEKGGRQWHVGDQLEVMIKMYDFQGRPKKSGGDVLLARLHNQALSAGVSGQVLDHLNGSYSAVFSLLWEGSAQVEVTLVHPSEAVTVLHRLTREQPDRIYFGSVFHSGSVSEDTTCNVCLRPTQQPLCNYTDLITGEPWFCYKPKTLSCDTRVSNYNAGFNKQLKAEEEKLFQNGVNMKVYIQASGSASVTVLPKHKDQAEVKSSIVHSGPVGYYYQGAWRALSGTTVRQFNTPSVINQCLKGKVVHLYGDSTIRQWFEHLNTVLPDLKQFDLHSSVRVGPFMALDYANNILVNFRFHGPPVRSISVPAIELHYIANELDRLVGGTNTIVVFGIWAHFSTFPIEVYIRRLQSIRRAVVRLLDRAPGTLVLIRTANPKTMTLDAALTNSDWYSLQRDKVLRAMFKGLNVHLLDIWEMVLAHHLPHDLHPPPPIITNIINVVLSYICPQKGS